MNTKTTNTETCHTCHFRTVPGCAQDHIRKLEPDKGCGAWFHSESSLPSSSLGLTKLPPAWHAEAADMLRQNFNAIHSTFLDATRRAVAMGIFLNGIKQRGKEDGSIPHGQFEAWRERNVPEIQKSQVAVYMQIGRGVVEKSKLQISDFRTFALGGKLPDQVENLIAGKTQSQLLLEFKDEKKPNQYHPPKDATPDDAEAAAKAQADALAKTLLSDINLIQQNDTWCLLSTVRRQEIEDARLSLGLFIKNNSKPAKPSQSSRSAAARALMSARARARWAKAKAQARTKL